MFCFCQNVKQTSLPKMLIYNQKETIHCTKMIFSALFMKFNRVGELNEVLTSIQTFLGQTTYF